MNNKVITILLIIAILLLSGGIIFLYLDLGESSLPHESLSNPKEENTSEKELSFNASFQSLNSNNENYEINYQKVEEGVLGAKEVNQFIKKEVEDFKEKANSEVPPLREQNFNYKYTLDIELESYQTEDYLSYILSIGEYTGGANVNQVVESFVFNKENYKEVSLSEIILPNKQDQFMQKVRSALKEKDTFPGVAESFYFSDIHCFYLTEDKINIRFSKYEIAPGAAGILEISIKKDNLL